MAVRVRIAPSAGRSAVLRLDVAADGPDGGRWWSMEVQRTPALGRHVIASRELAAGDVVCAAPVHALSVLESDASDADVEATLGLGQLEEQVLAAKDELNLMALMSEWKPWEGAPALPHALARMSGAWRLLFPPRLRVHTLRSVCD